MPYTTLVGGTTITASWANANVRDQVVTPFASSSARTAAVSAPVAGMASVLTDTNRLDVYDGAAYQLASYAPGFTFARKSADQAISANTTLTNDTHLSAAVLANATYSLDMWLFYISTAEAADLKVGFTFPASATLSWGGYGLGNTVTGSTTFQLEMAAAVTTSSPIGGVQAFGTVNGVVGLGIRGVLVTAGTAGTLQFQWAQNVSNAAAVTMKIDSSMTLVRRA